MKPVYIACLLMLSSFNSSLGADDPLVAIDVTAAGADPDYAIQGEYVTAFDAASAKGAQIVALGKGQFRIVVYNGGLPGAGWDRKPPQVIPEDDQTAVGDLIEALQLEKTDRQSPTLGLQAPSGAVVLFDGTQATFEEHWQQGAKITSDQLLEQGATSTDTFQDFTAHVEFMTPYMPFARGQGRGNSGVYYQGRYETQVLDSFGLEGKNNETGGIYEIRDPDLNMCFSPLVWQTYDVEFTAARFDGDGQKTQNAKLTVRLNGIVVQRDVEVPRITRAAPVQESAEPGPIYLQDHGNPVRYRNIWVLPRDAEREARRPLVPGFERFLSNNEESTFGGQLLVGELGCVKCHSVRKDLDSILESKHAPILTKVGSRVQPQWMMDFISRPHDVKPGTTMPDLFAGWDAAERTEAAQALVNFLASTGRTAQRNFDLQAANRGRRLFHETGCIACHAPIEGPAVAVSTSVPLPKLSEKYTSATLAEFLKEPHAVRPSGRMPALGFDDKEAFEIALYLAGEGKTSLPLNVKYALYDGSWEELPDFSQLEPARSGVCSGLDLSVAQRGDGFGLQFEAYFKVEEPGEARFWLGSDDGSALYLDGKKLINVDGIHPHTVASEQVELSAGVHRIRIDYFELGGEESLTLEARLPGGPRLDMTSILTLNEDGSLIEEVLEETSDEATPRFRHDPSLIQRGQQLFTSLGCANCHALELQGKRIESQLKSPDLADLSFVNGCLADQAVSSSKQPLPEYDLSPAQKEAIRRFVNAEAPQAVSGEHVIQQSMTRFNCYACHERGGMGGPEFDRNLLFLTTEHEMGDEGRIPPPLNGVGDKLQESWLKNVVENGSNERPYMLTRMPKFGGNNVGHLVQQFVQLDQRQEAHVATFDEPEHRIKSTGRKLVGNDGLACIKCHTFGNNRSSGIQAISLTGMTRRIREDWFLRYLFDPAKYRPGTRMPTGYPNGKAVITDLYEGDPGQQISAIWNYLTDGNKAGIPDGLIAEMIELKPVEEPIIYRNFIEGLSPRGIAIGYPEKAHLAWDANELCLKLIWHGRFMDASQHWVGRGPGFQAPLGDHIMVLDAAIPFAQLGSPDENWPTQSVRELSGYEFLGYRLNESGQPTFLYETPFAKVTDFPKPIPGRSGESALERRISVHPKVGAGDVYFRAAVGDKIELVPGGFLIDDARTIEVSGGGQPRIRQNAGKSELLVPLNSRNGAVEILERIYW